MTFEADPVTVLQNEMIKTSDFKKKIKLKPNFRFKYNAEEYIDKSDQDFIDDYVNNNFSDDSY